MIQKYFNTSILLLILSLNSNASDTWYITKLEPINQYRVLNGTIEAINKATVSAQTTGRVENIYYDVDDFVKKDSILVEFTNIEQKSKLKQANEIAKAAKIAYLQAQTDYKRIKGIYEKKLIAKSQLDKSLSQRDALQAQYSAAEASVVAAKKQFEYTLIRAPYDGIVTQRFVEVGETVNPSNPIMEGISLSQLRIVTHIPESMVTIIRDKPQATIVLANGHEIFSKNLTIFPYADPQTRTFKSRIYFDSNDTDFFPGMSVEIKFKINEKKVILIPLKSLVRKNELSLVYVNSEGKILPRQVKVGRRYNDSIVVISGLNVNEKILVSEANQ